MNNPNEHEALAAALSAVKLIVEHGFKVHDKVAPSAPSFQYPDFSQQASAQQHEAFLRDLQQAWTRQR